MLQSCMDVVAHNIDKTENVYFDTVVEHTNHIPAHMRENVIGIMAINKLKAMLDREHPMLLAELVDFHAGRAGSLNV